MNKITKVLKKNVLCKKCGSKDFVKNGLLNNIQRYKCKSCKTQFTSANDHQKQLQNKLLSIILYINGLKLKHIASLFNVSQPAVIKWIKFFENIYKIKLYPLKELNNIDNKLLKSLKIELEIPGDNISLIEEKDC